MPNCRKCKEYFPYSIKINGKLRNLQNRKFCLKCSPFGSHNTHPDDPSKKSYKKQVNNKRVKYSEWSDKAKKNHKSMQYYYRHKRLKKSIEYKGGKCEVCGYNKSKRALTFHHIHPKTKLFSLDSRNILTKNWDVIVKELDKCQLLCMNCHMELHENESISKYHEFLKKKYDFNI